MKAIINLKKSSYKNLNGHTFDVAELIQSYISLIGINPEYPQNQVDFNHNEVIIVNLAYEFGRIKSSILNYSILPNVQLYKNKISEYKRQQLALIKYIESNKIKGFENEIIKILNDSKETN